MLTALERPIDLSEDFDAILPVVDRFKLHEGRGVWHGRCEGNSVVFGTMIGAAVLDVARPITPMSRSSKKNRGSLGLPATYNQRHSTSIRRRSICNLLMVNIRFALLIVALVLSIAGVAWAAGPMTAAADDGGSPSRHFTLMIVYAAMALVFSFLCSVAEAVVLSVSPSYIANLRSKGRKRRAAALASVKNNIDQSLAAILTLNTIAHTVGAGGAGAEAAAYFGEESVGISMAVLTLLILFLSEIIPKTIGALYWRQLAPMTARFVQMLSWVLFPLIYISEKLTKLITGGESMHMISREELAAMAEVGAAAGQLDDYESRILKNVFKLPGLRVADVMTPRTVVFALQQDLTVSETLSEHPEIHFSRIPVYAANHDEVTGFVLKTDLLLNQYSNEGRAKLRDLKRELRSVPTTTSLSRVLEDLLETRAHILLVVDEYGGMDGVVTLEDVVETLIGFEIVDEADQTDDMRRLARQRWQQRREKFDAATRRAEPPK